MISSSSVSLSMCASQYDHFQSTRVHLFICLPIQHRLNVFRNANLVTRKTETDIAVFKTTPKLSAIMSLLVPRVLLMLAFAGGAPLLTRAVASAPGAHAPLLLHSDPELGDTATDSRRETPRRSFVHSMLRSRSGKVVAGLSTLACGAGTIGFCASGSRYGSGPPGAITTDQATTTIATATAPEDDCWLKLFWERTGPTKSGDLLFPTQEIQQLSPELRNRSVFSPADCRWHTPVEQPMALASHGVQSSAEAVAFDGPALASRASIPRPEEWMLVKQASSPEYFSHEVETYWRLAQVFDRLLPSLNQEDWFLRLFGVNKEQKKLALRIPDEGRASGWVGFPDEQAVMWGRVSEAMMEAELAKGSPPTPAEIEGRLSSRFAHVRFLGPRGKHAPFPRAPAFFGPSVQERLRADNISMETILEFFGRSLTSRHGHDSSGDSEENALEAILPLASMAETYAVFLETHVTRLVLNGLARVRQVDNLGMHNVNTRWMPTLENQRNIDNGRGVKPGQATLAQLGYNITRIYILLKLSIVYTLCLNAQSASDLVLGLYT